MHKCQGQSDILGNTPASSHVPYSIVQSNVSPNMNQFKFSGGNIGGTDVGRDQDTSSK